MNDYIKREEALRALCDPCAYKSACYSGDEIPACPALWTMLNIPAADVVERKKGERKNGEWRQSINSNYSPFDDSGEYLYQCSRCKRRQNRLTNFCPNCGADMRGEG